MLIICTEILNTLQAQDTLYYSVENVSEEFSTSVSSKSATNKDLRQFSEENERSQRLRKDKYLISLILSQISNYTIFKTILPEDMAIAQSNIYKTLQIAINVFNNNIEYQFRLSQYEKSFYETLSISNFFINPDIPEYQNKIIHEIQKLFEVHGGTNKPPVAKIRIDGKLVNRDTIFYRSHQDTIVLDGSSSSDEETPKKLIEYTWRVNKIPDSSTDKNSDINAYLSDFRFEESQQKLVIREPGKYTFSLEVSDGITKSVKDSVSIFISVINKPILELNKASYEKIYQGNLQNYLSRNNRVFRIPDSIGYNISNFDPLGRMIFKYLYSNDKSREFFLEIKPGSDEGFIEMTYKPENESKGLYDTSTVRMSGLRVDTSQYERSGSLYFWRNKKITPGNHKYLMYTNFKGVTSNFDTVTVSFREKSFFNIYTGYERFTGYIGEDYFNGFAINLLNVGFRFYLAERLSANIDCLFPQNFEDYSETDDRDISLAFLSGKINYDIPTGRMNEFTGGLPLFFSGFAGGYRLQVAEYNDDTKGYTLLGGGVKIRAQLFANNTNIGVWYIETEMGWFKDFKEDSYTTGTMGIKLVYGLWRY